MRHGWTGLVGSASSDLDHRGGGAAATRYQWSRKLHGLKGKRLRDSMASEASWPRVCARVRVHQHREPAPCVHTHTSDWCMPAGVIDIGKYAMADRSQRAGTNDCSTAHTATYQHIGRRFNSAIRLGCLEKLPEKILLPPARFRHSLSPSFFLSHNPPFFKRSPEKPKQFFRSINTLRFRWFKPGRFRITQPGQKLRNRQGRV